jgi:DNA invertase Pin-like site-specific DNA recombinase
VGGPFTGLQFAVYARKSTEDARHEDHKSTTRQVAQATRYVEARGGTVLGDHVYVDEASSGAEFRGRSGLLRFLDVLKNGRPFNALVMMEDSRLGREQVETAYLRKQITDAGIRLFYYLDDREARMDSALDKMMSNLNAFAAEVERERARQRCRDAAERRTRQGYVAAGGCYGYTNLRMRGEQPAGRGETHDYVRRHIHPEEAAVVRGIFQMYAAGWGTLTIAKTLNGHPEFASPRGEFFGGTTPAPPSGGRTGWNPMTVRTMLSRDLYRGRIVWGRTRRIDKDGKARILVKRDAAEWLTAEADTLRIVDDDLWAAVQKRLAAMQETYLRDTRGKLWGQPDRRREGQYLLSGLARCAECGANITVLGRTPRVYGCRHHEERGICGNLFVQRVDLVDVAFLDALERKLLHVEGFRWAIQRAATLAREALVREPDAVAALEREQAALARKIERMVTAIGDGQGPKALVQEIATAEARVAEIEMERTRLTAGPALDALDVTRIERDVTAQLARFGRLLAGDVPRARQALKKLLVDRVAFRPVDAGGGRQTYEFTGEFSYGAILREVVCSCESLPKVSLGSLGVLAFWEWQRTMSLRIEADKSASTTLDPQVEDFPGLCRICGSAVPRPGDPISCTPSLCSERCLAQAIVEYWKALGFEAQVGLRDGFARLEGIRGILRPA